MQTKKKIGLVVLSFMLILTILNFAPQVDTIAAIPNAPMQNEVSLSATPATPPPSMIAYWELNENGGTTVTDSIVPYVTGHTAGGPRWVPGVAQSGLEILEGQFIDFGRPSYLYLPEVLTIEAWVNLPDPSGIHTIIMNAYNPTNIQYQFGIQDGHLYFDRQAGAPGNAVTSLASITPGQWHHVVVVMNWGLRRVWFYLDGVDDEIYPYNDGYTGPSGEVTIGADRVTGAPSFLNGLIDEVAIYNDMLDQAIIQEHYQKGLRGLGYLDEMPINEPPVAIDDSYTMSQDTTLTVSAPGVLANDYDVDGDSLVTEFISDPLEGILVLNPDGSFTYDPRSGFDGIDTFEYRVFDGEDYSAPAIVTITVEVVNTPPESLDDAYFGLEDLQMAHNVLDNDLDLEGDSLESILVSSPTNGTLDFYPDGSFTYLPDPNWFGVDSFTYQAFDGQEYSNVATVTLTIDGVNDAPFVTDDAYFGLEDLQMVETTLLDNDFDLEGDPLELVLVSGPSNGTLDIYPDGTFTYLPDLNWFGVDSFTYQAFDGLEYSNVATVTITIESVNDVPIVIEDDFLGLEDSLLWGDVLANDYDVEWDDCIVFLVETALHGTVDIDSGSGVFSYLPDPDWFGIDSFTYNVYDGHMFSDVVVVILDIQPVNDAPVAYSIAFVGNEDVVLSETLPLGFDVDGDALQYIVDTGPAHGILILDSNTGAFSFTPDTDWFGSDSFTYQIFDGELYSGVTTVDIFILEDDDITGPEITIIYTGDATDSSPGYWDITVFDPESGVASISVEIDGILVGTFEGTYLVPNAPGDHQIVVNATNADSNNGPNDQESSTSSNTVTIVDDDITGPIIDITYFGDMTDVNPGFWTVSVNDSESGVHSILVEIDGVAVGTYEGDFGVPSSLGFHSITVTAINGDTDIPYDQETSTRSAVVLIEGTTLPTELTYTGDLEGVYSDPVYLEALLIDATTGMPIFGKIIHFSLGPHTVTALTDVDGLASISIILYEESGIYGLVVSFDGDDEYLPSSSTNEFLLNKECASLVYSGLTIIEVSEESMTLIATVFDDVDGYWGNLSLAYVTFTVYLSSDPITPIYISSPVKVQTTDVIGIGLATVEIPNLPEGDYLVIASLLPGHNRFYCGPDAEAVMVTIYEPERAHALGAGKIIDADGHRGFFVFKAKYTCDGTLKGFLLYTYVSGDWVYLVRSRDITGFVTDGNHGFFEANGTISRYNFRTHEKVCSDERYRIRVDVFDNKRNHERDVFQIRVFDNLGQLEYEAGFDPFGYILRGCIVVRHGRRH